MIDDRLRLPEKHLPTVGILMVADKSDTVVRYSLAGSNQPIAVSRYELAAEEREGLPEEGVLVSALREGLRP